MIFFFYVFNQLFLNMPELNNFLRLFSMIAVCLLLFYFHISNNEPISFIVSFIILIKIVIEILIMLDGSDED